MRNLLFLVVMLKAISSWSVSFSIRPDINYGYLLTNTMFISIISDEFTDNEKLSLFMRDYLLPIFEKNEFYSIDREDERNVTEFRLQVKDAGFMGKHGYWMNEENYLRAKDKALMIIEEAKKGFSKRNELTPQ
jgi:hypothetical protein